MLTSARRFNGIIRLPTMGGSSLPLRLARPPEEGACHAQGARGLADRDKGEKAQERDAKSACRWRQRVAHDRRSGQEERPGAATPEAGGAATEGAAVNRRQWTTSATETRAMSVRARWWRSAQAASASAAPVSSARRGRTPVRTQRGFWHLFDPCQGRQDAPPSICSAGRNERGDAPRRCFRGSGILWHARSAGMAPAPGLWSFWSCWPGL